MELKDKIVVITGGSKGLGRALAKEFVKNGSKVIITARKKEELDKTASEVGALGIVSDVTKEEQVIALAEEVVNKLGRIDVWINNAGMWIPRANVDEFDWKRGHEIMELNYFGVVYGSKAAVKCMKKEGTGAIINILSTSALHGRAGESAYVASKYAARGFTESLLLELEGSNISIVAVYPGGMRTNLFDEGKPKEYSEFMDTDTVANKIVENLKKEKPDHELILRRPKK